MSGDKRRRALTISPYGTKRPTTGGTKRIHYLNRGYAAAGWDIYQISNASVRSGVGGLLIDKDNPIAPGYVEGIYFNPALLIGNRFLKRQGTAQVAASLLPSTLLRSRQVERCLNDRRVVIFEHPQNWDLAAQFLRDDHFVVLDAHNIESRIWADQRNAAGWQGKAARALEDVERRAMRRADLVFMCSEEDRDIAIAEFDCDPAKIEVAANGVDCASFAAIAAQRGQGQGTTRVLFVGSNWAPNIEAAQAVLAIAKQVPDLQFDIVGTVGDALRGPFPVNVTVTGAVDDLDHWFGIATIAINPMSSGSGSNIKMFEYLAAGLPIVTTPFGARGVDDDSGLAIIKAPLTRFAEAIQALTVDPQRRAREEAARRLAERNYDWTAIAARIVQRIEAEVGL